MQDLFDETIQLDHLPTQSKTASVEEKRLAVRLIRARKAGSLTWEQEGARGSLANMCGAAQLTIVRRIGKPRCALNEEHSANWITC